MKITSLVVGSAQEAQALFMPDHTGAVTLLQVSGQNILVDTGGRGAQQTVVERLRDVRLQPGDINIVVLTHFHLDHAFNVGMFHAARVIGWEHEWRRDGTRRFEDVPNCLREHGIRLMATPGHAEEHIAVVAAYNRITTVIAGDAISEHYVATGELDMPAYDKRLARHSADAILKIADVIIPGHGEPFQPRDIARLA